MWESGIQSVTDARFGKTRGKEQSIIGVTFAWRKHSQMDAPIQQRRQARLKKRQPPRPPRLQGH